MHPNTIGIKAVMADGTIIDQMNPFQPTPAGYDLKQLFIGSEGTLVSYFNNFLVNHVFYRV